MWVLFQLYVHNIWYRFANNVIWHWITSMITVLFQIVSCWIVEIVNSQSSSSSEWDSDARKLVCLVGNPCDHPSHRVAKTSSTNNSQDYHQDDNDDHRTFLLKNNAKRSQKRSLNSLLMLGSKRVKSQFPIGLRVKCSDPGEWVSNSTKVPFISFLSSAKHCKFATNVSLGLFQIWIIHFVMISPSGNIFWKENNVGSLQPAKTSWWVANAEMIICELKRNSKSHTICLKHWFLPLVAILTVKLWTVPIPQNSLAEHIDFRLQIAHNE